MQGFRTDAQYVNMALWGGGGRSYLYLCTCATNFFMHLCHI